MCRAQFTVAHTWRRQAQTWRSKKARPPVRALSSFNFLLAQSDFLPSLKGWLLCSYNFSAVLGRRRASTSTLSTTTTTSAAMALRLLLNVLLLLSLCFLVALACADSDVTTVDYDSLGPDSDQGHICCNTDTSEARGDKQTVMKLPAPVSDGRPTHHIVRPFFSSPVRQLYTNKNRSLNSR